MIKVHSTFEERNFHYLRFISKFVISALNIVDLNFYEITRFFLADYFYRRGKKKLL